MANDFDTQNAEQQLATIGPGIVIKGEVGGSEDLLIQGAVEGTINLRENTVTVGASARVGADIFGRVIHVHGEVIGNLSAREQVVVHSSGQVHGNISAPRLSLEDGARLKGSIDTECAAQEFALSVETIRTAPAADRRPRMSAGTNSAQAAAVTREVPTTGTLS